MPVRAVKILGRNLTFQVPAAIKQSYISWGDNSFGVMFQRHFDKDGALLSTIAQPTTLTINSIDYQLEEGFRLAHHPLVRKHGILCGEFLEIAFLYRDKGGKHDLQEAIFPEREIVELDNKDIGNTCG